MTDQYERHEVHVEEVHFKAITAESDLCSIFIRDLNRLPGWRCYPETAGFDILAVHEDGRQIGVEGKLTLNAKVAEQILPKANEDFWEKPGPDYRLVIVSKITDASAGIARMLEMYGILVLLPTLTRTRRGDELIFTFRDILEAHGYVSTQGRPYLFDWNPMVRCTLPRLLQTLPAGVPSPIKLTPYKEAAVKLVALMRHQGFLTAKQIAKQGVAVSRWTHGVGLRKPWLKKGMQRGQWVESDDMPPFDKQHPELYQLAVTVLLAELGSETRPQNI
jgi:hypothetical protein